MSAQFPLKNLVSFVKSVFQNLTFVQRFMLAGFVILLGGMFGIGAWVEQQIVTGVVHRTGATTALYVDSIIAPQLQTLNQSLVVSEKQAVELGQLVQDNPIGQQIVALKIWSTRGQLLYTTDQTSTIGKTYPMSEGLLHARLGEVFSEISSLNEEENQSLGVLHTRLLEIYSPVWLSTTDEIIAVAEFYQSTEALDHEISILKQRSWLVVGAAILVMYVLLSGFVRHAGDTMQRQKVDLANKVAQLTALLAQNRSLHSRIRRASASVAQLNEGFLRRIGSELHDGPAQDLGLSVLQLDAFIGRYENHPETVIDMKSIEQLNNIQANLQNALKEMRAIAAGLSLPQLMELDLAETVTRVVRIHERRTATQVKLELSPVPNDVALSVKITIYRLVQEALNNAYRHAGGSGQCVRLSYDNEQLCVEISDTGPGFDPKKTHGVDGRLGLSGMRERIESLGGSFSVDSQPGKNTKITARLLCKMEEGNIT